MREDFKNKLEPVRSASSSDTELDKEPSPDMELDKERWPDGRDDVVRSNEPDVADSGSATATVHSSKRARVGTNQPIKLKNYLTGDQFTDTLHMQASGGGQCRIQNCCTGALMNPESALAGPVSQRSLAKADGAGGLKCPMWAGCASADADADAVAAERDDVVRSNEQVLEQAIKFLDQYYQSIKKHGSRAHRARIDEVAEQIRLTSTYHLLKSELVYGAKLAWRNTARCIGRIQWNKLQVFDARLTTTAQEMFEAICTHIRYATNRGQLRSAITIFPRRVKSVKHDYRVWNTQLIGYAGYEVQDDDDDNNNNKKILGDPANVEFTQICERLGWRGARTRFDVLPLVLSASGGLPQLFELPDELVLRVQLRHPHYDWFNELQLEWYALPAVSNMMLDVGGLQFPAAPFNGWYMGTEIGTRDLCDAQRYNILSEVAALMQLNSQSNVSLWKDRALVEVNSAVLYSFQQANVTIVDHHTASESFMAHMRNEQKLRGGCPADWVWIVPPTGASTTEVFHQEMINYHLLPNYEAQAPAWRTFDWTGALAGASDAEPHDLQAGSMDLLALAGAYRRPGGTNLRKYRLRETALAVSFSCRLYKRIMARRTKCSIVFATETGKSERYAQKLSQLFGKTFNVQLQPMDEWCWRTPTQLLLVVASTFGNGEPPENGEAFARSLKALVRSKAAQPAPITSTATTAHPDPRELDERRDDAKSEDAMSEDAADSVIGDDDDDDADADYDGDKQPELTALENTRYSVFALGSTAYPNFCAFGRGVDAWLEQAGASKMLACECGDEMSGQENKFDQWARRVYKSACDTFEVACDTGDWLHTTEERQWSPADVKFIPLAGTAPASVHSRPDREAARLRDLINLTNNKRIGTFTLTNRVECSQDQRTISVQLACSGGDKTHLYEPGDHVAVYPVNSRPLVEAILDRMRRDDKQMDPDQVFKILVRRNEAGPVEAGKLSSGRSVIDEIVGARQGRGKHSIISGTSGYNSEQGNFYRDSAFSDSGSVMGADNASVITSATDHTDTTNQSGSHTSNSATWAPHDTLPSTSLREALRRYLDISSAPSAPFLAILSQFAGSAKDKKKLLKLASQSHLYEQWKLNNCPNLLHVLDEFKSIKFKATLLTQLPLIQARFYSISSSPARASTSGHDKHEITLTVGLVQYSTNSGHSRQGLCSNYLNELPLGETVYGYVRSASSFHLPAGAAQPTITATVPPLILVAAGTGLAPFRSFWEHKSRLTDGSNHIGDLHLYFGCRNAQSVLYQDEINAMLDSNIINSLHLAYSRSGSSDHKQYVQHKLEHNRATICKQILEMGAHVYVCGDVAMAEAVYKTLNNLLSGDNQKHADQLVALREQNRYHEDIFGAKPTIVSD